MKNFLKKINTGILDTLFPIFCLTCRQEGAWLCQECLGKIKMLEDQVCPYCEKIITIGGNVCPNCQNSRKNIPLDGLVVATRYKEEPIAKLIHLYKYNFIFDLQAILGEIILKSLIKNQIPLPDLILPVPLHPRRLRWRGFNQSELLADYISKNLTPGMEIAMKNNLLQRKRYTPPQMKIKNYQARQKNLRNAFSIKNPAMICGKNILLVDDVATTGSTLFECAEVLKSAGAKKVSAVVVARQEI